MVTRAKVEGAGLLCTKYAEDRFASSPMSSRSGKSWSIQRKPQQMRTACGLAGSPDKSEVTDWKLDIH
jgi:hypothetical protein